MTIKEKPMVTIILILTALAAALIAGLFYAYCCSVSPGLGRLNDAGYLAAMQSINLAILNPLFFASFLGTLILLPVSTWLHYNHPMPGCFWLLLLATLLYIAGVIGVTALVNVPLNNTLARFNIQAASPAEIALQRAAFEAKWNTFNAVRAIASAGTLLLVLIACVCSSINIGR
jgi:uncharacterized membrane protein